MPSFDNIYDLTESLDAEKVDHFIVTIQKPGSATNGKTDIFYRLSSRESLEAFCAVMDNLINNERDKFVIGPPPRRKRRDDD